MWIKISLIKFGWSRSAWKYFEMFYWPLNALKSIICTNERQKMRVTFMSTIISIIIRIDYKIVVIKKWTEKMSKRKHTYFYSLPLYYTQHKWATKFQSKLIFSYHKRLWEWFRYFHIFSKTPSLSLPKKNHEYAIKKNTLLSNASERKWLAWKTDRWTHEWNNKITWTWPKSRSITSFIC